MRLPRCASRHRCSAGSWLSSRAGRTHLFRHCSVSIVTATMTGAEREEAGMRRRCDEPGTSRRGWRLIPRPLVAAAREAAWTGRANRAEPRPRALADHRSGVRRYAVSWRQLPTPQLPTPDHSQLPNSQLRVPSPNSQEARARDVILQRRSAVAFDARSGLSRERFCRCSRVCGQVRRRGTRSTGLRRCI